MADRECGHRVAKRTNLKPGAHNGHSRFRFGQLEHSLIFIDIARVLSTGVVCAAGERAACRKCGTLK